MVVVAIGFRRRDSYGNGLGETHKDQELAALAQLLQLVHEHKSQVLHPVEDSRQASGWVMLLKHGLGEGLAIV